jgi:hypothetical protein
VALMLSVILSTKMEERLKQALADSGLSETQFLLATLDAELTRRELSRTRKQPKEHRPKNPVGRPRLSAEEKQFRDAVREIDEVYLSLWNDYLDRPGVFEQLYGRQRMLYEDAKVIADYKTIQWWRLNAPWQKKNPADFEKLYASRESLSDTVPSNDSKEG